MVEETKKEETKKEQPKVVDTKKVEKKDVAVANAYSLPISTKNSVAICRMIMGKTTERAIEMLELVLLKKMAVPMRGDEIPHRRRGLMPSNAGGGGRFPVLATKEFINLLKQLKANCDVNGVDNAVITLAVPNLASRPNRKEGRKAKRTNIHLEARDKTKLGAKKK